LAEDDLLRARLAIAPSVRLLSLDYPVADLRRRLRVESDEPVAIPDPAPHHLVVYRRELRLWDMPVSRVAFVLLEALARGLPLGVAAESAADTPQAEAELGAKIGDWFREWTTKGLIGDVVLE
jgi:hypothetical protein